MVVSQLDFDNRLPWQVLAPPVEKQLASHPGATIVRPPRLRRPTFRAHAPAWLSALREIRRADALFWFQMSSRPATPIWALTYARPTARRSAWVIDSWAPSIRKIGALARAQRMSPLFVGFRQSQMALRTAFPRLDVRWLPFAANTGIFHERPVDRDIFAYWMGRRSAGLEHALEAYCAERGLELRTDRASGDALGNLVSRARYFVVTPPDVDDPVRTGGFSPLTSRYFEGLAGGARLLGQLPSSGEYQELLPLDAILQVPATGEGLAAELDRDAAQLTAAREAVSRAQATVAERHTWTQRADQIYEALASPIPGRV